MKDRYGHRVRSAAADRRQPLSPRRTLALKLALVAMVLLAVGLAVLAAQVS